MEKPIATVLFYLLALACSQTFNNIRGPQYSEPVFLKTINNYFGCKTWNNSVCIECSDHYHFNGIGICCQINPQCKRFNQQVGICEQCYQGYTIVNGACVISTLVNSSIIGCKTWTNGTCTECAIRWYFDSNNICQRVNDFCRTWLLNGNCDSCYYGYTITNGTCTLDQILLQSTTITNTLCSQWNNTRCTKCSDRSYFNPNGICTPVSDQCATWDSLNGMCLTCYNGYSLNNGQCVILTNVKTNDLGCKIWDWNNNMCVQCAMRWVMNSNGNCVQVSNQCSQWDTLTGACTACYSGYTLNNGQCVILMVQQQLIVPAGCNSWDSIKQVCLQCSMRWVLNPNGTCIQVSDQCSQWDAMGACTACYGGYTLTNGQCVIVTIQQQQPQQQPQQQQSNPGCKLWDCIKQICLQCSPRYVLNSNSMCIQVSDLCSQWDMTGACTACYNGYQLSNNQCQLVNTLCKTLTPTGACSTCYNGYVLYQGNCTPISQLANIVLYYSACCPQKLQQLMQQGRL